MYGWVDGWRDAWMCGVDVWMDGWMDVDECVSGGMFVMYR